MIYIKAVNLKSSIEFIKNKYGDPEFEKVVSLLSDENKKLFLASRILDSQWVSMDSWINFWQIAIKELCNNDESVIIDAGVHNAKKELTGIYKAFLKISSPLFLVRRVPFMTKMYLKSDDEKISVTTHKQEENKFTIDLEKLDAKYRLFELGLLGWVKEAFTLSGAKDLQVAVSKSLSDGEGIIQFAISWA